ncbi:MAG: CHAD domain-containing protein [Gallionellaceae bacterium]|jgi:inorganic triphosphatase YgiF|nr:CHAD domain-containing protein [Gallionellaceae bacterium]
MSVEKELKLCIAPEHLNRLKRHPLLKSLAITRATTRRLHNVYYDTPDLDLHRRAMALRLRRIGRQWLQTLKGGGEVQAGLHQRNEWETPVAGEALDFKALEASGSKRLPGAVRKKLCALFVTDFSRTSRMLAFGGAEIELSMDSGEIRAGRSTQSISELELELKSGEPLQLFRLALALLDIVPLEVEPVSKAEHGYRLYAKTKSAIAKAHELDLTKCQDVPAALQGMIWSCLLHLQANVPGAVHKLDNEYLHQVRVALRRLRVVLGMVSIFRDDDAGLAALREEVAALCVELGRSREWDVFVTQTLAPVRTYLPEYRGLGDVLRASKQLREQHHARVQQALQSQDFQRLLLRFGVWMNGSYWHKQPADNVLSLPEFSAQILRKYGKQVIKRGRKIVAADASQLHALRIACKKLRYSLGLFSSLYARVEVRRDLSMLTALQDILGALNDIAVAHRLLDELDTGVQHKMIAIIRGWIEHDFSSQTARLRKAWRKFHTHSTLWK